MKRFAPVLLAILFLGGAPMQRRLATTVLLETGLVNLPATSGLISTFGGPNDPDVGDDEPNWTGKFTLRSLNPSDFYIAMRWPSREEGLVAAYSELHERKLWWEGQRVIVYNTDLTRAVCCWVADWGPHPKTRRAMDLSPGAAGYLQLETDELAHVEFADPDMEPGPIQKVIPK